MTDRLSQIRQKIKRAKHHINDLESQWIGIKANHDRLAVENDTESGERIYRLLPVHLPDAFPLIVGDAIHNLRSALDHLLCHLVLANGNTVEMYHTFPIYKPLSTQKARDSTKVHGVDPRAVDLIEAAQPYNTGCDLLWKLHKLDIDDKHITTA